MALVTKNFKTKLAKELLESFSEASPTVYYVFLSQISPWPDEDSPPTQTDTVQYSDYDVWRGMIGLKKISNTDVTLAISRYPWTTGTVYTEYSNRSNFYNNTFYTISSNNNVYKCMFNNNGAQSTVQPTGTSTSTVTTSDGYKWKFMYNVDSAKLQKFLTENHIPVQTLTADDGSAQWDVQQAAANGSIEIYDVTAGGSGYLQVKGNISAVVNSSVITLPAAASGTSSVYVGSTVFISSGLGAGQLRQITNYSGTTKRLTVNTAFTVVPNTSSTFHVGPYINISGDGSGASAYANVSSGAVSRITAINNGSNYSRASVNITANPSYGSGAAAIAYLSPHGGHGSDAEFELGGSNVMLNAQFDGTENGFIVANNDFRVYGIVTDPLYANGSPVLVDRANQTTRLTLTSVSGTYTEDEFVSGGTSAAKGRVVQFANTNAAGTTGILSLTNVDGSFTATETVTANTSGVTATLSSITLPDVEPFTGKVIYIVNRTALDRDVNQTEDIKFTVKF